MSVGWILGFLVIFGVVFSIVLFQMMANYHMIRDRGLKPPIPWWVSTICLVIMFIMVALAVINLATGGMITNPPECPEYEQIMDGPIYRKL